MNHLGITKMQTDAEGLGQDLRFHMSNKLSGDADAAGLWITP